MIMQRSSMVSRRVGRNLEVDLILLLEDWMALYPLGKRTDTVDEELIVYNASAMKLGKLW